MRCSGVPPPSPVLSAVTAALSRIKAKPELEGHGLALAGLIIGYIAVAGWLIWILLFGGLAMLQGISEGITKH